ncbi:hypothetical protein FKM82_028556 [Ascaphus truei]
MPSLPPPNTTISSLMDTARCPCRGLGTGPDQPTTRFQRGCRAAGPDTAGEEAMVGAIDPQAEERKTRQKLPDKRQIESDKNPSERGYGGI